MEKYLDSSLSAEKRAEAVVEQMTVEEQADQLKYDAPALERLGIKAYNWWNEGLHGLARSGVATVFPQAIGLAAMFDEKKVEKVADIVSTETRAKYNLYQEEGDYDIYKGLTLWSPNINIFRDPRWGRGHETYGEDPYLTAECGKAYVRGLQGSGEVLKTAACAKHFAVHSGPENLRHEFNAVADERDLEETYLPAFEALVKETHVEGVMGAYNRVNGEGACASDYLMKKLADWGFDGYFVSDCWAIRDFHEHHGLTNTPQESAALALKAGCDVNCGCTYQKMKEAYQAGMVSDEDIRRACYHLMRTRMRLGMWDKTEFDTIPYEVVACKEHKAEALACALKSMVLLENDGLLPLAKEKYKTIAVIGPNANSTGVLEGNYNGLSDRYHTFLQGIQEYSDDYRVLYAEGCHLYKDRSSVLAVAEDRMAEALGVAKRSDLVVLCVGLAPELEGEEGDTGNEFSSGDKRDLRLPESQQILIRKVLALHKPTVIVNATGSSVNVLDGQTDAPNALIQTWYPGELGGTALAKILFGEVSPSGKLPVTFYESAAKLPDFTDYAMHGNDKHDGRTYRFLTGNVLYPFGYGLTYSKVVCDRVTFDAAKKSATVTIHNEGSMATEEVVELFLKDTSEWGTVNPALCGFQRVFLAAGESVTVEIPVADRAFTSVNADGVRDVFGKQFVLYVGTHQPDALSTKLSKTECVSVTIAR